MVDFVRENMEAKHFYIWQSMYKKSMDVRMMDRVVSLTGFILHSDLAKFTCRSIKNRKRKALVAYGKNYLKMNIWFYKIIFICWIHVVATIRSAYCKSFKNHRICQLLAAILLSKCSFNIRQLEITMYILTSMLPETSRHKQTISWEHFNTVSGAAVVVEIGAVVVTVGSSHFCTILKLTSGGTTPLLTLSSVAVMEQIVDGN